VDRGRREDQAEEAPVPRAVEEEARSQQPEVLRAAREQQVDGEDEREEDQEGEAVEENRPLSGLAVGLEDEQAGGMA
jgi:hypothetical protein